MLRRVEAAVGLAYDGVDDVGMNRSCLCYFVAIEIRPMNLSRIPMQIEEDRDGWREPKGIVEREREEREWKEDAGC